MGIDIRLEELRSAATRLISSEASKDMPGFTLPSQERTRRKTASIVAVAAHMLQTRPFSEITLDEIADAAACSVPTIYARFENKEALLPAIHLLTIESARTKWEQELTLDRFVGRDFSVFCRAAVDVFADYYSENRNLIHAVIINYAEAVHLQCLEVIPPIGQRLNTLASTLLDRDPETTRHNILFGIKCICALLRDSAVVPSYMQVLDRDVLAKIFGLAIEGRLRG